MLHGMGIRTGVDLDELMEIGTFISGTVCVIALATHTHASVCHLLYNTPLVCVCVCSCALRVRVACHVYCAVFLCVRVLCA